MIWNPIGHWFVGLPLGYTLCFILGFGVIGLWWGLSTGLIICGVSLLYVWWRRVHDFDALGAKRAMDAGAGPHVGEER